MLTQKKVLGKLDEERTPNWSEDDLIIKVWIKS